MENNLKFILYLTVNLKNNKIYIGIHKTSNPNGFDGYIGCGVFVNRPSTYKKSKTPFQFAVNKYGVKNFKRITLGIYDTLEEAKEIERYIVDDNFLKREDVYNATVGGGETPDTSIEIYQYDLNGIFIKSWKSSVSAADYFNIASNNIRNAIKTKGNSCGYLWTDIYYEKLNISDYNTNPLKEIIYKFDANNNLIDKYNSVIEAAEKNNSKPRLIFNAISGKTKSKGFYYSKNKDFKISDSTYNKINNVYLYNLDGSFFKEFKTPKECALFFDDKKTSRIYAAIRTGGLYKNYQITNCKVDFMKNMEKSNTPKKVGQYDLNDNLIKIWDTIQSAYLQFGAGVKKCLKGLQNQTKGYKFKYIS